MLKNKDDIIRFIKFGIVGSSGILVNTGTLWILHEYLGLPVSVASAAAIAAAIFNNFNWNNLFTWNERREKFRYPYLDRLWRYYISTSLGAAINFATLLFLTNVFEINYLIANLFGIVMGMIFNFILSEKWVFRE